MSTNQFVKTRQDGPVFLIGINRANKKNCVNHATALQLIDAFEKFNEDSTMKTAVLYGEGGTFCAGYDLESVSKAEHQEVSEDFCDKYRYMGPSIMKIKKPLIAAIEGFAVAGGLELSLMADLRVSSPSAKFGVFCRRVGVPLIDGGTVRLPRVIGLGRALDMILTGREVGAQEALQWGLVNRISDEGKAVEEAVKLGKLIASHPEICMLADRESTYYSLEHTEHESFEYEFGSTKVLAESIKGAQQFMEKQKNKKSKL
ncbi:Enoyl-CoA hydratase [Caenorhabditis elegans]|uniref:Enoyl-CoA hydratase n=2 Tax=Caenorhabditis elegans TaxID=6239 RepID=Q20376_CAEEL|nr:Enoyl-CoA hydratase [Caenorhabditis elegans]CCD71172.1 Enoyl-CoA hydratase [Caenorhabditis elegans]|eukprot:NP_505066.1 Enoyl-CoA Hydratase [Caenorhabditis elegans]